MDLLYTFKRKLAAVKRRLTPPPPPVLAFDENTLPWIDRDEADIDAFLREYQPRFSVNYDLAEKLRGWRENGYVVLEQAIQPEWLDVYWNDVLELLEHPEKYQLTARIDLPKHDAKRERVIGEFPKEDLKGKYVKINDFHNLSVAGKQLMAHPAIVTFLEAIFQQSTVGMQSLTFLYGSQQPTHQDFPWVTAKIPSHLAAAWIALEDIQPDSGPLYYYRGSHRLPKFDFGNGILYDPRSTKTPMEFAEHLDKTCMELGYPKETLLVKKGDVLIWHGGLAHGGGKIDNPEQTRKSFVCHYSTAQALPFHRYRPSSQPITQDCNGMSIYAHPEFYRQENILNAGENLK